MKTIHKIKVFLLAVACFISFSGKAQMFVRYVKHADLTSKVVYADSLLTNIKLSKGTTELNNYSKINIATQELNNVLNDATMRLLEVWVIGSSSPEGLYRDNAIIAKRHTDAVKKYFQTTTGLRDYQIHSESIPEDWDRLYNMVKDSNIPYKYEVMEIIRTKQWGARKSALMALDHGRIWKLLQNEFFSELKGVRIAIYCLWDPSKPYLANPEEVAAIISAQKSRPITEKEKVVVKRDTIYIRDTIRTQVIASVVAVPKTKKTKVQKTKDFTPRDYRFGIKTNLAMDAIAIPYLGLEVRCGKHVSIGVDGVYTRKNIFHPDPDTKFYGILPEVRYWTKQAFKKGHFVGAHCNLAWFTGKFNSREMFQNYNSKTGSINKPAISIGLLYGYNFTLGKKEHWNFEIYAAVGYASWEQRRAQLKDDRSQMWKYCTTEQRKMFGPTKIGINFAYRFSLKKR
ncbi:MAG: DUF3575 domain-containing protein [Alistipes sp.]|nr:DUF3575 domain-containing protein [Candidatus Alistipes equi]